MNTKRNVSRTIVFAFALLVSAMSSAWHGGGGGYYHGGGGGYYHGHGDGGYYHVGGGYYGGGWGGPTVVIGTPGYYAPSCETVRVCNSTGQCWLQQSCD